MRSEPAAFLDRDGTLIEDVEYLADPNGIVFLPGAFEALRLLRDAGFRLILVTNQSGIARGLYSLEQYRAVEARVAELLEGQGIHLDAVFFCPHHPDFTGICDCRKPLLGMYQTAARNLGVDLAASVYIGDRMRDVEPALKLGGRGILVGTDVARQEVEGAPDGVETAANILAAARLVAGKSRTAP